MFKIWIAKLFGVSFNIIDKNSPVLYWIVFTSFRMCLQTCLFAALSWPTVSLLEPYRRCWPTATIQLQRWDTFFYSVQWLPQHIYMLWDPRFCWDSIGFVCVFWKGCAACLLCAPPYVNTQLLHFWSGAWFTSARQLQSRDCQVSL